MTGLLKRHEEELFGAEILSKEKKEKIKTDVSDISWNDFIVFSPLLKFGFMKAFRFRNLKCEVTIPSLA